MDSPNPDSPYVQFNDDRSTSIEELERELIILLKKEESIQRDIKTQYATYEELKALLSWVPPNLPKDRPLRVVQIGDLEPLGCGGTHVRNSSELGPIHIRGIKRKGNEVKVRYAV